MVQIDCCFTGYLYRDLPPRFGAHIARETPEMNVSARDLPNACLNFLNGSLSKKLQHFEDTFFLERIFVLKGGYQSLCGFVVDLNNWLRLGGKCEVHLSHSIGGNLR